MSFFDKFINNVASDVLSAVSERAAILSAENLIKTCYRQLGWSVHEQHDVGNISFRFSDPIVRIRYVLVSISDQGATVGFAAFSAVNLPAQRIPSSVLGWLLQRNDGRFVAWKMFRRDDGNCGFGLSYRALTAGLQPAVFKMLCMCLLEEVQEFDAKMHEAELL